MHIPAQFCSSDQQNVHISPENQSLSACGPQWSRIGPEIETK